MKAVWPIAVAAMIVAAAEARADTVFLKDGQTIWGTEVIEEDEGLVIVRPGEQLRIPKSSVDRVERSRVSIPRYFEAPSVSTAPTPANAGAPQNPPAPVPPAASPTAGSPSGQDAGTARPTTSPPPAVSAPAPLTPTLLPPPPPPSADRPR